MMHIDFHAITRIELDAPEEYNEGQFVSRTLTIHYKDYDGKDREASIGMYADTKQQLTIREGVSNV